MPSLIELLKLISSEKPFSVEDLAIHFACSVEDIRLSLHRINEDTEFVATDDGGYLQWANFAAPLNVGRIKFFLGASQEKFFIDVVSRTGSTNTDLLALAREGMLKDRQVRLAEIQEGGRGSKSRSWVAIPRGSIALSVARIPQKQVVGIDLSIMPLIVGLAVAKTLRGLHAADIELKWPNDVVSGGKKLGGILVEAVSSGSQNSQFVIGLGLNLNFPRAVMEEIDQPVTHLLASGVDVDRNDLISQLLLAIDEDLMRLESGDAKALIKEWNAYHYYQGREVQFRRPDESVTVGRVLEADASGAILLETEEGVLSFHSGEISFLKV